MNALLDSVGVVRSDGVRNAVAHVGYRQLAARGARGVELADQCADHRGSGRRRGATCQCRGAKFRGPRRTGDFHPGQSSAAKLGTAMSRLVLYPLDNAFVDMSRMRQLMHAEAVETTMTICSGDDPASISKQAVARATLMGDATKSMILSPTGSLLAPKRSLRPATKRRMPLGTTTSVLATLSFGLLKPGGLAAKALSEKVTPERLRPAMTVALDPRFGDVLEQGSYTRTPSDSRTEPAGSPTDRPRICRYGTYLVPARRFPRRRGRHGARGLPRRRCPLPMPNERGVGGSGSVRRR